MGHRRCALLSAEEQIFKILCLSFITVIPSRDKLWDIQQEIVFDYTSIKEIEIRVEDSIPIYYCYRL